MFAGRASRRLGLTGLTVLLATAAAPADLVAEDVSSLVAKFRKETKALVGVHVVRLADGKAICDVGSGQLLIPASNQKILTAAVALRRLGKDFQFRTRIGLAGADLVVIGDGDPTIGDPTLAAAKGRGIYDTFDRWAAALKRAGVRRIDGDLVIRAGIFRPPAVHPAWPAEQLRRWYTAPVGGVNFRDNCVMVGFKVAAGKATPVLTPASRFLTIVNKVKVSKKKHVWSCRFSTSGSRMTLRGTVSRSTPDPYPVAVRDPNVWFGVVLADRLVRAGIALEGKIIATTAPAGWAGPEPPFSGVTSHTTPLADVLRRANCHSLNMAAECLLLRSAVEAGRPADWSLAAATARRTLREHYGLAKGQFRVSDGSGLSKKNLVTPAAITTLLKALADEDVFVRSLAVSAKTGSMRRRLRRRPGRVLGKTGSLAGASALSGYVLDRGGKPVLAFSIITNGRTRSRRASARRMEEQICEALIRSIDPPPATGPASRPRM